MSKKTDFWEQIIHFKKSEFDCKCGCGFNNIDEDLVLDLDLLRSSLERPLFITSASRCNKHNKDIRGSPTSSHLLGLAIDIRVFSSSDRFSLLSKLLDFQFKRIGIYKNFIHVDIDFSKFQNLIWYK